MIGKESFFSDMKRILIEWKSIRVVFHVAMHETNTLVNLIQLRTIRRNRFFSKFQLPFYRTRVLPWNRLSYLWYIQVDGIKYKVVLYRSRRSSRVKFDRFPVLFNSPIRMIRWPRWSQPAKPEILMRMHSVRMLSCSLLSLAIVDFRSLLSDRLKRHNALRIEFRFRMKNS